VAGATKAQAGRPNGPTGQVDKIAPESVVTYRVSFLGGEWAQVRVHGYGRTVLNLAVYNADGELVAKENDREGNDCLVSWLPAGNEVYTIRVINRATVSNTYWISAN
jgi:hypothetical protein